MNVEVLCQTVPMIPFVEIHDVLGSGTDTVKLVLPFLSLTFPSTWSAEREMDLRKLLGDVIITSW